VRDTGEWRGECTALGEREGLCRHPTDGILLKAVHTVHLKSIVHEGEGIAIVEQPDTGPQHPRALARMPGQP